jgi:hypothetical protein
MSVGINAAFSAHKQYIHSNGCSLRTQKDDGFNAWHPWYCKLSNFFFSSALLFHLQCGMEHD